MGKWTYFEDRDELRYAGKYGGGSVLIIENRDIEIYINMDGEINEIVIYNASKHVPLEKIKYIASTTRIGDALNK